MSTIPLVALSGPDWKAPDTPLEAYTRAAQLQAQQQQIAASQQRQQQEAQAFPLEQQQRQQQVAAGQMQQQAQQMQLQDMQTLHQLAPEFVSKDDSGKVTGYDYDGFYNKALESGVNPQTVQQARAQQLDFTQKLAAADKTKQDAEESRYKKLYDIFEGIKSATDPAQRQQAYLQSLPRIASLGLDIRQLPPQVPNDQALNSLEAPFGQHAQMLADAKTVAETKKAAMGDVSQQELNSYLTAARVPGESLPPSQRTPASFAAWKARQSPMGIVLGNQLGAAGMGSALDQSAERYSQTGELPSGFARSPGTMTAIIKRAAELHPDQNIAGNKAVYGATKTALTQLQAQASKVDAFESTAGKNLDLFLKTAQPIIDSGSPWINTPLRKVGAGALGSKDIAAFNTARTTAITEIAKVLNSPTGSGVLSDSARKEVEGLIGPDATLQQIVSAANILRQDMSNRHDSYQEGIESLQKQLGGASANPAPKAAPAAGMAVGSIITQNGHRFKVTAVDKNGKVTAADPI